MECFRLLLAVLAALAGARVAVCPVVGRGARPDGARPPPGSFPATRHDDAYRRRPVRHRESPRLRYISFQPTHDSRQILDDGQVAPG